MDDQNKVFVVTRLYISASDYNSNGYTDVEVCRKESAALDIFSRWREEELQERKRLKDEYEVLSDTKDRFHCTWDSGLETVLMTIKSNIIKD